MFCIAPHFLFHQSKRIKVENLRFSSVLIIVFYSISVFLLSLYVYTASEGRTKIFPQNSLRQKCLTLTFCKFSPLKVSHFGFVQSAAFVVFCCFGYCFGCFALAIRALKSICESTTARKTIAQPRYSRPSIFSFRKIAEPITPNTDSRERRIEAAAGFTPFWPMI